MEGSADYLRLLDAALEKRASWLDTTQIPQLREALNRYIALFESAMSMLIRKGLLREDPYQYEQGFAEITIPSDEILPEFESSDEVSYRLASFRRQIKYLATESPLDLRSLGLPRLKKMSALLVYVNWLDFGDTSKSPTTRAFARAFMKVRMGSDTMAAQILKDSEIQIMKAVHQISSIMADLISFNREAWKAELRRKVLPEVPDAAGDGKGRREEAQRAIRRIFAHRMPDDHWYPALADEVLEEELAADGAARKEKLLASLTIAEPVAELEAADAPEGRSILLEAVRVLCRPHEELALAQAVLEQNEGIILESRGTAGGWLRRIFGIGATRKTEGRVYKVQYAEPGLPTAKTETVDFPQLLAEVRKKSSLMAALSAGTGPAYRKLEATNERQLAGFVDRQLNELLLIHRRLGSLNTLFQARIVQAKKAARGIKIELLTIKNCIVKANQKRHEYRDGAEG